MVKHSIVTQKTQISRIFDKNIKNPFCGLETHTEPCAKRYGSVFKKNFLRHSHTTFHNHYVVTIPQKAYNNGFLSKPEKQANLLSVVVENLCAFRAFLPFGQRVLRQISVRH